MSEHTVYLVLGTNLGNRYKNLSYARSEINNLPKTRILKKSKIYKSSFYGPIEQPFFFNLALKIKTQLSPISLLKHLQKVEKKLKRKKNSHMKPRTIDIENKEFCFSGVFLGKTEIDQIGYFCIINFWV